jgi:polyisoprenoid-binding protein YceI
MKKHITVLSSIMAFMVLVAFTPVSDSDGFYKIDLTNSGVKWVATKITDKTHEGTVNLSEGGLQLTEGVITGGKFTIDMTSIIVTDLTGGMKEKLEGHLKNEDFFNVEKFKTANIAILSVDGDNVKANLTIKGITNEVSFPVKVVLDDNGGMTATADMEIDRTKFDVRYGSDSFFDNLGDKVIKDMIKFSVSLKGAK